MSSMVGLFVVLFGVVGVVSVTAQSYNLEIGNPNGVSALLSPNSISVTRQLPSGWLTGTITLAVTSIRELDNNYTEVGSKTVGPIGDGSLLSPTRSIILGSNPDVKVNCQAVLNSPLRLSSTTLTTDVCGIMNNGTVNFDTESSQVATGQLGFSLQLKNWPWSPTGRYVELKITVSVMAGRRMSVKSPADPTSPMTIGLGTSDSYTLLSTKVQNSTATFATMPSGYPRLTQDVTAENKASVTIMLPRSSQFMAWQALVEPGYQPSQKPPGLASAVEGLVASWMIQAVTAALACWIGSLDRRQ